MLDRLASFMASLRLAPEVEGRSADRQHGRALTGWRSRIQRADRTAPMHLRGAWTTRWDGTTQPQELPDRPPLLDQDPTLGAHEYPFVGDRLAPTAWDGEPGFGAPNIVQGG